MSGYFPNYETICKSLAGEPNKLGPNERLSITANLLITLIKAAVRAAPFDESDYLRLNADIAEAKHRGEIVDLHRHFIDHGYFEGRRAYEPQFDEAWYLKANRDVAIAVRDRDVASALEHYQLAGQREWRAPNEGSSVEMSQWREVLFSTQRSLSS